MNISIYEFIAFSIDFEGSIGIKRSFKNDKTRYSINVQISNSSKELLEKFKNIVKFGRINGPYFDRNRIKNKNIYQWNTNKEEMKLHLPKILPFLTLKWRQCELAIEVLNITKNIETFNKMSFYEKKEVYTWEEICILESCYQECFILNEKGVKYVR